LSLAVLALTGSFLLQPVTTQAEENTQSQRYTVEVEGEKIPVLRSFDRYAKKLDDNDDRHLTLEELAKGAEKLPGNLVVDYTDFAVGLRHELTGTPSPYAIHYPSLEEVQDQILAFTQAHPDMASVRTVSVTHEGRPVQAVTLRDSRVTGELPKVLVVANQHAREWVGVQVALRSLEKLTGSEELRSLLSRVEVWMVPMANPDGYHYSREVMPMWRKNRSVVNGQVGVDLNRNYAESFRYEGDEPDDTDDDKGGSDHPDSAQYRGASPHSERESSAIAHLLSEPGMIGLLDLHSFGCKVLIPNEGSTLSEREYRDLGRSLATKLGEVYRVARYEELYDISGHLAGHADQLGIPGITLEIGRAFQPHPSKVEEIAETASEAVIHFVERMVDRTL
jgi:predicted deacylase